MVAVTPCPTDASSRGKDARFASQPTCTLCVVLGVDWLVKPAAGLSSIEQIVFSQPVEPLRPQI
jgi:hypothetical protein